MFDDLLKLATELKSQSRPFVLATVVGCKPPTSARPGAKAIVQADGTFHGWVGGSCAQPLVIQEARKSLQDGQTRVMLLAPDPEAVNFGFESFVPIPMTCQSEGTLAIYLEPFLPRPRLVVIGASPVARSLAHQGNGLGFRVCVCDPAASSALFPNAEILVRDLSAIASTAGTDIAPGYVVIATMGHYDEAALEAVAGSPFSYLGLVASPRRGKAVIDYLVRKGISSETLQKVKYPAGLDIGAETPEEVAMSVLCEIVQKMRAGNQGVAIEQLAQGPDAGADTAADPICKMTVSIADARYVSTYQDNTFYFCCPSCQEAFDQDPGGNLQPAIG
ncbi:MAG TPA: XdhC family protein [Dehalococcoidia bacterium]|nr:XdhC family protein [Dehalococcoidia bacterium]